MSTEKLVFLYSAYQGLDAWLAANVTWLSLSISTLSQHALMPNSVASVSEHS